MAQKTGIEWTDMSANPIRAVRRSDGKRGHACVHASPGCLHCYSERWNSWRGTGFKFNVPALQDVDIILDHKELQKMRRIKGGKVFVCDMTDLFGPFVPDDYIAEVFAAMVANEQVTWQVLTKRPTRMATFCSKVYPNPLANVWYGTSVENQEYANKRIPGLLRVPARVRFLSCEPLLGPVELCNVGGWANASDWWGKTILGPEGISWVIAGGESGAGARPMHPEWARSLRDQCQAAQVPFFMKQWGEWCPGEFQREGTFKGYWQFQQGSAFHEEGYGAPEDHLWQCAPHGDYRFRPVIRPWPDVACVRLGKKWSGRELDGREWSEFPG